MVLACLLVASRPGLAGPELDAAWRYLTKNADTAQWAVVSVDGNPGYVQCARNEDYLRCPFPVWARLLPDAGVYRPVSQQASPHPELAGTELKTYMAASQAGALTRILSREGLEFRNVYSLLEDQSGATVGTNYEVVLILKLDYGKFERLVANVLQTVWGADITQRYRVDTDRD